MLISITVIFDRAEHEFALVSFWVDPSCVDKRCVVLASFAVMFDRAEHEFVLTSVVLISVLTSVALCWQALL